MPYPAFPSAETRHFPTLSDTFFEFRARKMRSMKTSNLHEIGLFRKFALQPLVLAGIRTPPAPHTSSPFAPSRIGFAPSKIGFAPLATAFVSIKIGFAPPKKHSCRPQAIAAPHFHHHGRTACRPGRFVPPNFPHLATRRPKSPALETKGLREIGFVPLNSPFGPQRLDVAFAPPARPMLNQYYHLRVQAGMQQPSTVPMTECGAPSLSPPPRRRVSASVSPPRPLAPSPARWPGRRLPHSQKGGPCEPTNA